MKELVSLAKLAVETYVKEGRIIDSPKDLSSKFFKRKTGVFVTIEKNKELRGCIGTYLPTKENILEETIYNAISAATEDCRFEPIKKEELPYLSYTVYILNKPELVKNIYELNPYKFGIIVKTIPITISNSDVVFNGHIPYKTGILLPNLEGIDTIEKQISIACYKAGINPEKEPIIIYKFTVEKFSSNPLTK